jgi:hypothetical protein
MSKQSTTYEKRIARAAAAYAHEALFSRRRGFVVADPHLVVLFDNNPDAANRYRRLKFLKECCTLRGIEFLAEASYGRSGYTIAMVWRGRDGAEKIIGDIWDRVARRRFV